MTLTTEELESYVEQIDPAGPAHHIPLDLLTPPAQGPVFKSRRVVVEETGQEVETFAQNDQAEEATETGDVAEVSVVVDFIARDTWHERWIGMHDTAGFFLSMQTKAPCPLGKVAGDENGLVIADFAYDQIEKSAFLRRIFWGEEIGMAKLAFAGMAYVSGMKTAIRESAIAGQSAMAELEQAA